MSEGLAVYLASAESQTSGFLSLHNEVNFWSSYLAFGPFLVPSLGKDLETGVSCRWSHPQGRGNNAGIQYHLNIDPCLSGGGFGCLLQSSACPPRAVVGTGMLG